MNKRIKSQAGIALVLEIVAVAIVLSVVTVAVVMSNQAKAKQAAEKARQEQLTKATSDAKKKVTLTPTPTVTPDPTPVPATATPKAATPTPKPATPTPKVLAHPTNANCLAHNGRFTVYASVAGGTKTYWNPSSGQLSGIVVPYGTAMSVWCSDVSGISSLSYGDTDSYVKAADVSTTKP
jgi:hypothetical protein